ncbi:MULTISPECIES: hypothetical protein [Nitrosomonas]
MRLFNEKLTRLRRECNER